MKNIFKKALSLALAVMMVMSLISLPVSAANLADGNNNKTIYLSLAFTSDNKGLTPIESVSSGATFYVFANFANNPATEDDSAQGYQLFIGYDSSKVTLSSPTQRLTNPNVNIANGIATATWANTSLTGISSYDEDLEENVVHSSGSLFRMKGVASTDLTLADLNQISFLASKTDGGTTYNAKITGKASGELFTIATAPALSVEAIPTGTTFVKTSTAADIKAAIPSITFIDAAGTAATYTSSSAEWANLSVALPTGGLVLGENTVTASYNGYTCDIKVTVTPSIASIKVATQPNKTNYTAFEKFDKTGMVVKAVYEDNSEVEVTGWTVDETTELKVGDTAWEVAYNGFTTTVPISVDPLSVVAPVAETPNPVFTGENVSPTLSNTQDSQYYTIENNTGINADAYVAKAVLKDKVNTVWAGGDTADKELYWSIDPAAAPSLSAAGPQTLLSNEVVTGSKTYTYNLDEIITGVPANAGTKTYYVDAQGNKVNASIDGSTLTATVDAAGAANENDAVDILVGTQNYENAIVTINFTFKSKTNVDSAIVLNDINAVYGDVYTVAGYYENEPATGGNWTYTYKKGSEVLPEAPKAVGSYTVTAHYEDNEEENNIPGHIGEKTVNIVIAPKALTLADGDVVVTKVYDGTTAAGTLTGSLALNGIVGTDDVTLDMSSAVAGDYSAAEVGTGYTVAISGYALAGLDKDNYTLDAASYNFANASITKQLQAALTINGGNENIAKAYGDAAFDVVVAGGNGEGAYALESSDETVLKLTANGSAWTATILKAGEADLTAKKAGDSNYEPATDVTIKVIVSAKVIADSDFGFELASQEYTGEEIKPAITTTLVEGTDYDVVYANNVNAGQAEITVTAKGNYQGSLVKNFMIIAKELNETDFTVSGLDASYDYDGAAKTPAVSVAWGEDVLVADTDYTVAYSDNTNAGNATVTIAGVGNFGGSIVKNFVINPADYVGTVTITATGRVVAGSELGINAPAGDVLSYQWLNNGIEIEGANADTYIVQDGDETITVEVTSTGNYVGTIESSEIVVGKELITGTVTIALADGTFTATIADAPAAENYDIVWLRDGVVIEGAAAETYALQAADKGCEISAKIVANGINYSGEIVSNAIAVPAEAPSFEEAIVVTPAVNSLVVKFAALANGSAITEYKILVDGAEVDTVDAASNEYTITGLTAGTEYQISVIAVNGVGETESDAVAGTPKRRTSSKKTTTTSPAPVSSFITVKTSANGAVKASANSAKSGDVITLTIAPNEGFALSELTVIDYKGNKVSTTKTSDGYTFVMPASAVTVEGKFVAESEAPVTKTFTDVVEGSYYADAVKWVVEKGITNGISDTEFGPENACTRAQIVTFLWRAAGSPKAENTVNAFKDVAEGSYYYDAVLWAVENGITNGLTEDTFGPDAIVSRAQTVTFLYRMAKAVAAEGEVNFNDVADSDYFADAVKWAVSEGITNGVSDDSFAPMNDCTRGQIVTFIFRYFA